MSSKNQCFIDMFYTHWSESPEISKKLKFHFHHSKQVLCSFKVKTHFMIVTSF